MAPPDLPHFEPIDSSGILLKNYDMEKVIRQQTSSGAVYGLGLIGAAIYFISHATSFWMGALGVLKALVWPALLVYEALRALGA